MDAERFSLVEAAFHRAMEASGEERERVLAELCGEDHDLRREVQELLAAAERPAPRLDRPDLPEMLWEEPRQIGPYRVLRRLGQGGSSVVYLAVEEGEGFSRQVALKGLTGFKASPSCAVSWRRRGSWPASSIPASRASTRPGAPRTARPISSSNTSRGRISSPTAASARPRSTSACGSSPPCSRPWISRTAPWWSTAT